MTKTYSNDLRQRVIDYLDTGSCYEEASKLFKISISPMVFNDSCNTRLFEGLVEQYLIKELKAGQVVIMDNAAFIIPKKLRI